MSSSSSNRDRLRPTDAFAPRHLGPTASDVRTMLDTLGYETLDALVDAAIPDDIRLQRSLDLEPARSEREALEDLTALAERNDVFRSYIGMGYCDNLLPTVIQRNILENPGWYTQYTPYQAEISQGRMEALLNFQTLVLDLTGAEVANSSLLDEGTAAAEAMTLCQRVQKRRTTRKFFVSDRCHPQTISVVQTRAEPLDIEVIVGDHATFTFDEETFGALLQYPATDGAVLDYEPFCEAAHEAGAKVVVAADLLALVRLRPPVSFGADVVVGSSQRFGMPMGYGGPHAAFLATRDEYKRMIPGRIIGLSKDAEGNPALRMALQTREQHIRREKATSNICTAQVLPAVVASMYAVYHGPAGLRHIAERVQLHTAILAAALREAGYEIGEDPIFDTLHIKSGPRRADEIRAAALSARINLRYDDAGGVGVTLDETVDASDVRDLFEVFGLDAAALDLEAAAETIDLGYPAPHGRRDTILEHPTFHRFHSETEMLRYMHRLQAKDLSLTTSMIPLGSCTMKLNATTEMVPITWPGFAALHPFAPTEQAAGYLELFRRLEAWCAEITGFAAVSLQPNAGSQGEYAGLLVVRAYHASRGDSKRNVCLIPHSAHGTNPASAVLAGMEVVVVGCDDGGNIDVADLRAKADAHRDTLAALMITYPSTHGVFEPTIREICSIVHEFGGQVYLDGANMNAMVGLCRPGDFGADVCHLNLHKTFCIPHGGGGPGVGPIGVAEHLAEFLPGHAVVPTGGKNAIGAVSAAPWGSSEVLPISYAYIAMMGAEGLTEASRLAILNANYVAKRLEDHYPVLYRGNRGLVAHECIIDLRPLHASTDIDVTDVAKRLMDFGFHAPTMSWPVVDTLMIEPTESESLEEIDRFCEAMITIREEIRAVERGEVTAEASVLRGAPHTAKCVTVENWDRAYSREQAVFPASWTRESKFWPTVARVDNVFGDRNLVCICPPIEAYTS